MTTDNQNQTPSFPKCTPADELEFAERALKETLEEGNEDSESLRRYCASFGFYGSYLAEYEDVLEFKRNDDPTTKSSLLLLAATDTVYDLRKENDELRNQLEVFKKRGELDES